MRKSSPITIDNKTNIRFKAELKHQSFSIFTTLHSKFACFTKDDFATHNCLLTILRQPSKVIKVVTQKMLKKLSHSLWGGKNTKPFIDEWLKQYMNNRHQEYWSNLLLRDCFYNYKNSLLASKYIKHFKMFLFIYNKRKDYNKISITVQREPLFLMLKIDLNGANLNKFSFLFLKYYLTEILYKYNSVIQGIKIDYYIETKLYYLSEKNLLSYTFQSPIFDSIDLALDKFQYNWRALNLEAYYSPANGSHFFIKLRLNYPEQISINSLVIPCLPVQPAQVSSTKLNRPYSDFKIKLS